MLDEVQLLVTGRDHEIVAGRGLVGALGAEGRLRQHNVEPLSRWHLVDRISQGDMRLDLVKVQVH